MLAAVLILLQSPGDPQSVYDGRLRQIDAHLPRLDAATVTLNGMLDDPVWRQASLLKGFTQYRPVDSRPAADSTEVFAFYAPDAIYFGIRAYEAHGDVVRATLADRDNIDADDKVEILLDTFNDRRRALLFAVNPLGAQQDGVRSEGLAGAAGGQNAGFRFDGVVDLNPDYVYESRGRVTPSGYEIEVRIPFKSLRYQSGETQDWGIQFIRTTQHTGYEDTWTPVVRASASFLIQSGTLKSLSGLRRGLVMDVTPEFTARVDGAAVSSTDYQYQSVDPDVGLNVRWGITQNLGAAGTVNPDFSQVEADVGQVTVNQRFALFYPEKRPFFLEGLEQFDTPNALIYTRQIENPTGGAKLIGKVRGTGVAYIGALDENLPSTDPGLSQPQDQRFVNLLRLRRDLGASSTVGLAYTDRIREGGAWNRVFGVDARVIWKKIWFSDAQIAGSWTKDGSGSGVRNGLLWNTTLYDRTGYSYGNHGELVGISPDFEAQSGFVNRVNVVQGRFANRFTWYGKPGALFENTTTFILISPTWRYHDFFDFGSTLEGSLSQTWLLTLRGGWGVTGEWGVSHQRFDQQDYANYQIDSSGTLVPFATPHGLYNLWGGNLGFNTPSRALTMSANVGGGMGVIFAEAAESRGLNAFLNVTWKPTPSIRVDGRWIHQRLRRAVDGSWFSTANIPRLKIEYQPRRDIFFRYVGQYTAQEVDALRDPRYGYPLLINGSPAAASTETEFRNDLLFSYRPIPGTLLYLGYGASLTEPEPFNFGPMTRTTDGFFLKASYLFRM
ncbi:MAG TPA: DUF5916 domain-containing protein [Gemmatimonadales bacterium]|nr:DUF5916 domain-containing protein [Gemmatimonadales bacterium]